MATDRRLIDALRGTAEIYGRQLSEMAATMLVSDLARFPVDHVLSALARCRSDLRQFPTVADIVARIPDTRPGPEQAWAMIPKTEYESAVWTEEMAEAFAVARGLLNDGDSVGARMAFKETYSRLLEESKAKGKPAKWTVSLGQDVAGRSQALEQAVHKGYITSEHAQQLLPDYNARPPIRAQLTGPTETRPKPELTGLREVMQTVLKNAPEQVRKIEIARAEVKQSERAGNVIELSADEIERRKRVLLDQARIIEADERQKREAPNPHSMEGA